MVFFLSGRLRQFLMYQNLVCWLICWHFFQDTVTDTKEKLEVMVSNLTEQSLKLEEVAEEIEVM